MAAFQEILDVLPGRLQTLDFSDVQELRLRENLLIGCIGRGGKIIIPSGQDTIEPGDSVIVVTCSAGLGKLEDILARGPGHE